YPLGDSLREAAVDAITNMARLLLAAGASEVITLHDDPLIIRSESDLAAIPRAAFGPHRHTLFSAHQRGGCPMASDAPLSAVDGGMKARGKGWKMAGSVNSARGKENPSSAAHRRTHPSFCLQGSCISADWIRHQ